ncbi:hypothetical protein GCM10007216_06560 [Thalassobacillus devorans]|uniref:DUF4367 domain-containing protein n=1 Tax=Thalassobacillus devorans TaxID=279813 RepID=A0ABQ1NMX0_9BACI|nr:hypothetical protein [Thalassobacillus devorans]NIK27567.1 hypothetical protein [Thalassobacillus devorans]GGC78742.1 hypothetical protein GCM10007216_06560 [Thalassobacillus devorans]
MKKIALILMIVLVTAACSARNDMQAYDKDKITNELGAVDFDYELPAKVPMEVDNLEVESFAPEQPIFVANFQGTEGQLMELEVINAKMESPGSNLFEQVEFGDGQKGFFYENAQGSRMLLWEKNGVHYQLKSAANEDAEALEDEELIDTAETFE